MAATTAFALLLLLAIAGAGGVLLFRRPGQCCVAFVLCSTALAGIYGFLDLRFAALIELAILAGLFGLVFIVVLPWFGRHTAPRTWWASLVVLPLTVLITLVLSQSAIQESAAGPLLPMWAVTGSHLAALGREWFTRHAVLLILTGLLLLASLVSTAYLVRDHDALFGEGEK